MLGEKLMSILYKGYSVPESQGKGRYVDMGMSFKKNEGKAKHEVPDRRPKRKPGELRDLVLAQVTASWQTTQDVALRVDAARESVRSCLEKLTKLGLVQSFGEYKNKQYRRVK